MLVGLTSQLQQTASVTVRSVLKLYFKIVITSVLVSAMTIPETKATFK